MVVWNKILRVKKFIVLFILIVMMIVVGELIQYKKVSEPSQTMKERWCDGVDEIGQFSIFFSKTSQITESIVQGLQNELTNTQKKSGKAKYNELPYCYCGTTKVNISSTQSSAEANLIGVNSRFFSFHSYKIIEGNYITGRGEVVLDTVLAWKLYGTLHVKGMGLFIENQYYRIVGVVSAEKKSIGSVYVDYDEWTTNTGVSIPIVCYEMLLLNPVEGYGEKCINETIQKYCPEADYSQVENSSRYSFRRINSLILKSGADDLSDKDVSYPIWENEARRVANQIAVLYLAEYVLALIALLYVIVSTWSRRCRRKKE